MTNKSMTPHQILATARLIAQRRAPYFQAGLMHLVPREAPGIGTFASTRDWILLWDPAAAESWGVEGVAAALVHELWHLIRDHHGRFSSPMIRQDVANIAGDLAINPGVRDMGFSMPPVAVWPSQFSYYEGLTAEEYYKKLVADGVAYEYVGEGGKFDATNIVGGEAEDGASSAIRVRGCGSCSGRRRRDEPENDSEGRSEGEIERAKVTIAKAIQAHSRGSVPGDLRRWAGDILRPPKIDWRKRLARSCRAAVAYRPGSTHSTYARVSRRQAGLGFGAGHPVIASYRATTPRAVFLIDTSGSMNDEALTAAMSEAHGVLRACDAQIDFAVCDAALHGIKQVKSIREATAMLRGGGGSDFRPAFEEILKLSPKRDIIIAATDGDITVPAHAPPGVQVIWLLIKNKYQSITHPPCAWGTHIEVDE